MARVDAIDYTDSFPKGTVQSVCGPVTIGLPIAELIDLDKERDRLQKEIKRLQGDIAKIDEKLGNAEFVSNAPPDIIEEQKSRKSDWSATLEKLAHALEQLKAA